MTCPLNPVEVAESYDVDSGCLAALLPGAGTFLLIESENGDRFWATRHATPEDAAAYNVGQEVEWYPLVLIDLSTGAEFEAARSIVWEVKS